MSILKILSFNIQYGRKINEIVSWLNKDERKLDILCFQEFPEHKIEFLIQSLPIKPRSHQFCQTVNRNKRYYGQLTVILGKDISENFFKVVDLGTAIFEVVQPFFKIKRQALISCLRFENKDFLLVNTHLSSLALNEKRLLQISSIHQIIDKLMLSRSLAQLIVGDFNYTSLLQQHTLFKFMDQHGFKNAHKHQTHRFYLVDHQLDYLFYKNCSIKEVRVEKIRLSDHYPVFFTVSLS